jgi:uncharacterized repeat protein (TIGR01451 family)
VNLLAITAVVFVAAGRLAGQQLQFAYDNMQRLTRVQYPDGTVVSYVYDNLGNRLIQATSVAASPTNQPPGAVTSPGIANGATDVSLTPTLSWNPPANPNQSDALVYYVYWGTSPSPALAWSGPGTNWSPAGPLQGLTTYYWYVVARDSQNLQTTSPVWSFTTTYTPPVPSFFASPTNGVAPATVRFYDRSTCIDDSIVSWAWSFNGNGVIDSTLQNPTHTFTAGGSYSVTLTVQASRAGASSITLTNYINVLGSNIVDLAPVSLAVEYAASFHNLMVAYSVTNLGTVMVNAPWQWADIFYVSTNSVLDAAAVLATPFYFNQPLPPQSSYGLTNLVTIPARRGPNDYLVLKANGNNLIPEISMGNNVLTLSLNGRLPDLVPGEFRWSGSPVAGGPIQVFYTATNQGLLGINAEWYDTIYFSTNAVLDSTATRIGIFTVNQVVPTGGSYAVTNPITLPRTVPASYYLILALNDSGGIVESSVLNNTKAIPISLTSPDLLTESVVPAANNVVFYPTSPQSPTVPVSWAITNVGTGVAAGGWYDRIYVSTNLTVSGQVSSTYLGSQYGPVPAGGGYAGTNLITLPQQSGTYYLVLSANDGKTLYQADYSDNKLVSGPVTVTYQVRAPALAAQSVVPAANNVVFYPTSPQSPTVPVSWAVTNVGTGVAAGGWYDRIYVSTNLTVSGQVSSTYLGSQYGPVPAGGGYAGTNLITLPQQSGTYYLVLSANDSRTLYQGDYSNNQLVSGPVTVTYQVRPPALAAQSVVPATSSVVFYPTSPQSPTLPVTWAVTNVGTGVAAGSWYDRIYVSTNLTAGGRVSSTYLGSQYGPVPVGGGYAGTNLITLPQQSGTYYLVLSANDSRTLYQPDYSNNQLVSGPVTVTYQVRPPALAAESVVPATNSLVLYPTSPQSPTVSVSWAVTNVGTGVAAGGWYDRLYVSTNLTVTGQISSTYLSYQSGPVPVGAGYAGTNLITLPQQSGTYFLVLSANDFRTLYQADYSNNQLVSGPLTVTYQVRPPALAAESVAPASNSVVFYPSSPQSPTVPVSWAVTNVGTGVAAGGWYDRLYVSTNLTVTGQISSTYLSYQSGPVPVGAGYAGTNLITLPQQSGTYYLVLSANDFRTLYQADYSNNQLVSAPVALTYQVRPPDLAAAQIAAPLLGVGGKSVQVMWAVTNAGTAVAAGGWYDRLYVSTNLTLSGQVSSTYLDFQYGPVPVGGAYGGTNLITLPQQTGTYDLILSANDSRSLYESDYSNNLLAGPLLLAVANSPGLVVAEWATPSPVVVSNILLYTVAVLNRGPADATGVVVTDALPAGVSFVSCQPSQGTYTYSAGTLALNFGTLPSGVSQSAAIIVNPAIPGSLTNLVVVSAASGSLSTNTSASLITAVLLNPVGPSLGILLAGPNLVLSWSTDVPGFHLQSNTSLAPSSPWVTLTTSPVMIGGFWYVTNPISGQNTFYRLSNY